MTGKSNPNKGFYGGMKYAQEEPVRDHWLINDLAKLTDGNDAIVYRVIDIQENDWDLETLTIKPVYGIVTELKNEQCRVIESEYCKKLTMIDMATEYARFGAFIAAETKRRNDEPPTQQKPEFPGIQTEADVKSTRHDDLSEPTKQQVDDDFGLCTDISARDEEANGDLVKS